MFEGWELHMIEEAGDMDTKHSQIIRVADEIKRQTRNSGGVVSRDDFERACRECRVNPDSFS